jgi:hypothetical protein
VRHQCAECVARIDRAGAHIQYASVHSEGKHALASTALSMVKPCSTCDCYDQPCHMSYRVCIQQPENTVRCIDRSCLSIPRWSCQTRTMDPRRVLPHASCRPHLLRSSVPVRPSAVFYRARSVAPACLPCLGRLPFTAAYILRALGSVSQSMAATRLPGAARARQRFAAPKSRLSALSTCDATKYGCMS